jgi:hypothetical protein
MSLTYGFPYPRIRSGCLYPFGGTKLSYCKQCVLAALKVGRFLDAKFVLNCYEIKFRATLRNSNCLLICAFTFHISLSSRELFIAIAMDNYKSVQFQHLEIFRRRLEKRIRINISKNRRSNIRKAKEKSKIQNKRIQFIS